MLVLSRFAGAAAEMDGALIVNPYDTEGVAESLQRGLTMPSAERRDRHAALMEVLRHNDIDHWRDRFLRSLSSAPFDASGGDRATVGHG